MVYMPPIQMMVIYLSIALSRQMMIWGMVYYWFTHTTPQIVIIWYLNGTPPMKQLFGVD